MDHGGVILKWFDCEKFSEVSNLNSNDWNDVFGMHVV